MAYEKQTWTTGEVITQEKLNHMEDGIENAVNGYECTETSDELFSETVTTTQSGTPFASAQLAYSEPITADALIVTFDGVEYTCPKQTPQVSGISIYGAPNPTDFSEFPFAISSSEGNMLYTQTAGEHTVNAIGVNANITNVTTCFRKAVEKAQKGNGFIITATDRGDAWHLDKSYQEIEQALLSGAVITVNGCPYQGRTNGEIVFASFNVAENLSTEQTELMVYQFSVNSNDSVRYIRKKYLLTQA